METKNGKAKCKRLPEMEPKEERKSYKVSIQAVPTKGLESKNSSTEETSCLRKCGSVIKYNRKQKDVEKATCSGNNGSSSQSKIRSANQIDDKAPSKQFCGIHKSACVEMERKGQEGCLAPMSTSEPYTGFQVSVRQVPAFDFLEEELLPEKMAQDIQVPEKEMTKILNHEADRDEKSSAKDKKKIKISSHEAAQKDLHDSLKARVADLRQETSMLNQKLRKHATMCMQLTEDNKLLMDELKKICEPCVIKILEARNPDKSPQTD